MRCPSCGADSASGSRFCASCGAPLADPAADTVLSGSGTDETRLSGSPATPRPRTASGSGWLSTGAGIDHGRFAPGTIVGDRYRIIGLLGRGGMGEVFRADDLRLGQPVALKFLPPLERDPIRLAQFHNEVRTARQVSHSNVCRVYDIGEVDGQHFLTMEFVDGEDLSSLIRRIGRLPEDKALEIARQICAGLNAAHERGLLHRDLKPANIMLDGDGRVRITDFSLAAVAGSVEDVRAGTPAYMAPEQLAGREVTVRSDIYALGLVLYELFTGKRALDAASIADLISRQESGAITLPTDLVTSLDPLIERAIMRCLQKEPSRRPASALAVAAALPGGDPLAAALAAGETPSPEMVAAAGSENAAVSPLAGAAWLVAIVAMLGVIAVLSDRFLLVARVPLTLSKEVLFDRAKTIERDLGLGGNAVDWASGFGVQTPYLAWLENRPEHGRFAAIRSPQPSAVTFWYRSSPRYLVSTTGQGDVGSGNPPLVITGMVNMTLGVDGRLYDFNLVPAQVESLAQPAASSVDWQKFFDAAGLDRSRFSETTSDWTPRTYADTRRAWTGSFASMPDVPVRIEAGSHRGWPVFFQVVGPWTMPARMQTFAPNRSEQIFSAIVNVLLVPVMFAGAALLARRNVKRGKGDRRGANRVAFFILAIHVLAWIFRAHHVPDIDNAIDQFFNAIAQALFQAGLFWVFYLAVEPQVRRAWPHILITWSRLVGGSFRDPLVGRDMLIGIAVGLLLTVITMLHQYVPVLTRGRDFWPMITTLEPLGGPARLAGVLFGQLAYSIQNGMIGVLGLAVFRMLLRRTWAAFVAAVLIFAFMAARGQFESGLPLIDYLFGATLVAILLLVALRYGLFATVIAFVGHMVTNGIATSLDSSKIYFQQGAVVMALMIGIALLGFYLARAGEPLFGTVLAED